MSNRHSYSCGLLYSVAPGDLASLHLEDDNNRDKLEWTAYETRDASNSLFGLALRLLKTIL